MSLVSPQLFLDAVFPVEALASLNLVGPGRIEAEAAGKNGAQVTSGVDFFNVLGASFAFVREISRAPGKSAIYQSLTGTH
jgi:hypothetical protein